ncbi:MAG TPA: hypothetical protein VL651_02805 [Bacteroidia bacterium]|jgi:hypothetical protein|nr:hypothetical protein [Bacteroidia bacterium]
MNNRIRTYISALLLACFSVFIIPNELVHALYGHEDTKHKAIAGAARSLSEHHVHCSFLTYEAPSFYFSSQLTIPVSSETAFNFQINDARSNFTSTPDYSFLRGPPSC